MGTNNQNSYQSTSDGTSDCIDIDAVEHEKMILPTNICISCVKNHRAVAFVPCAHYVTCLSCGHGMRKCPICREPIMACLRIYE